MKIGIPCEVKNRENRVSCTPAGASMLKAHNHEVLIQEGAGLGSGYSDSLYQQAGARIVPHAEDAWACDLVIKVKEPMKSEYGFLREGLTLFTYLHLAAEPDLTRALLGSRTNSIAYETISVGKRLPLLEPMSEIAGRMSTIIGAHYLANSQKGKGVLLGGVPGVMPGNVLVLGGGTAGINAGRMAVGLGADVTILDVDLEKMRFLDLTLNHTAHTLYSNEQNIIEHLSRADLLIGAVLVVGAKAPKLIRREMLRHMKPGSVLVDIAIDQGGCAETSRPTTHDEPVFIEEDILHYCVTNMPGAYARTATQALTNVTMPYALKIADWGIEEALRRFEDLHAGLCTWQGALCSRAVAEATEIPYSPSPFGRTALQAC